MVNVSVIPQGWEAHHRPVAESTMTALIEVTRVYPAGEFDPSGAGRVEVIVSTVARVQQHNNSPVDVVGEHVQNTRPYLVTLPLAADTGIRARDRVTVTAYRPGYQGDPLLIGRKLTVTHVERGSLMFERDLICTDEAN